VYHYSQCSCLVSPAFFCCIRESSGPCTAVTRTFMSAMVNLFGVNVNFFGIVAVLCSCLFLSHNAFVWTWPLLLLHSAQFLQGTPENFHLFTANLADETLPIVFMLCSFCSLVFNIAFSSSFFCFFLHLSLLL
jgi:hypothetical protein